ncbi:hypothetical protein phytr_12730 [Candidatus Phycorickettsia trachydisci]|uniref:PIN domain-containing protein n=1 Tax=Candidatus Phycorickettsia trachydisci TaxID=2115978 RepID=A0A2P1PAA2_9RICK|nr:type II toxin-antitoxin system VapC family toxin [Candidatus Phycorickettsia trachydisci]AVP88197.1 hypothetical protein phytr_12730 [Candidatus Phycorickettsia trachydisci]
MSNSVVLDASALLALVQEERGAEKLKPLIRKAVMSTVNVAESLTALQRINIPSNEASLLINEIVADVIPFDMEQALYVADLYPQVKHKGLSLGDRTCIALGMKLKAPIYTADNAWTDLNLNGVDIRLIR